VIRLGGEVAWIGAGVILIVGALASVITSVALVVMHAAWWWEDRRQAGRHSMLVQEIEEYLRGR
jgi:hypothetical protein